jgi:hypothetical protein
MTYVILLSLLNIGFVCGMDMRELSVFVRWSFKCLAISFVRLLYDEEHKGEIDLRFGYCDQIGKLIARPLYLTESQLADLGKEATKVPEIKKMLKKPCAQFG